MSLNACEAYLLELRKDEIWQLLYVQRQSEGEAYDTLVRKGLGWLGEQRFREIITKWEREESEVWPARPGYWRPHRCTDDHINCAHKSYQEYIRLSDNASGRLSKSFEGRQSNHQEAYLHAPEQEPITKRNQHLCASISLEEAFISSKSSDISAEPYSGLQLNAPNQLDKDSSPKKSLAEQLLSHSERPENPVGNWLLNTPLGMNSSSVIEWKSPPTASNLFSQPNCANSIAALCTDYGEDHSSLSNPLYDASSSYKRRESDSQSVSKPVSHIFGYIINSGSEEEEDSEGENEDKAFR